MVERVWRKAKSSYTILGNVNWYNHCVEQYGDSIKKTKSRITTSSSKITFKIYAYRHIYLNTCA